MANSYRTHVRQPRKIRFTETEWSAIVAQARAAGRPPARYVRETSLGAVPKARRNRDNDEVIRELGRIGIELKHLATMARDSGLFPHQHAIEETLQELLAAVRRMG